MSGRTFGVQSSWDDVFKVLGLEISGKQQRKAAGIADSMNQQIEEFLNRFVTTSSNDKGDLVFDATGTYTFQGDVVVNGTTDFNGDGSLDGDFTVTGSITAYGGIFQLQATEMSFMTEPTGDWYGIRLSTLDTDEFSPAVVAVSGPTSISTTGGGTLVLKAPTAKDSGDSSERTAPYLTIVGEATDGAPGNSINLINAATVYVDGTGGANFDVNGYIDCNIVRVLGTASASSPRYTFDGDENTGMYLYAADSIGFAMGGAPGVRFTSTDDIYQIGDYHGFNSITSTADSLQHTGVDINFRTNGEVAFRIQRETTNQFTCNVDQVVSNTANAAYLGYRFSDDIDTGIYRHGTDQLGLAAGGVPTLVGTSTGVAINNSTATGTGTNCDLVSVSVNSATMWAIRRDTSLRKYKSDILDFELSDEQFMAIQPRTFVWDGQYVGPDGRFGTTNGDDADDVIPEGSQLLRRGGFIFEELAEIDLHLIGHESVDWKSMTSALVAQVQKLQRRVDRLESGKLNS